MIPFLQAPVRDGLIFSDDAHTELRRQRNRGRRVGFASGNPIINAQTETVGMSARVCRGGLSGFASSTETDNDAATRLINQASSNMRFLFDRVRPDTKTPDRIENGLLKTVCSPVEATQKRFVEFARALDKRVEARCPKLSSRRVILMEDCIEKSLTVSDGFDTHSMMPRTFAMIVATAETPQGRQVEMYRAVGGLGLFADRFDDPASLDCDIDELYERIMRKCDGVYAEAGQKICVLDASLAGILAHEAVGHTVEADLVMSGSVALHARGCAVASPLISLTDFASEAFGEKTPLPVYVDDEGTPARDVPIIDHGILTGYMHNRDSAAHFGDKPQGNARAYLFSDEPLIRMRNTAIHPGTSKLENMIASVEDGYYFKETNNGQADMTGEFMFGITEGYEIKNGKLGKPLLDTTISGVAFEMLKTVDMVSDTITWKSAGMCGKKQPMPVGMGGPAIRCRVNVGGR